MNRNSAMAVKALSVEEFIKIKEKELSLCKKLSDIENTTKYKDFSLNSKLIHYAEEAIEECKKLMINCTKIDSYINHSSKIFQKVKFLTELIQYLKNDNFSLNYELMQSAEEAIGKCKQLMADYTKSNPGGISATRLITTVNVVNDLIKSLKKKITLFGNTKVYEDDILIALEKATKEFEKVAD